MRRCACGGAFDVGGELGQVKDVGGEVSDDQGGSVFAGRLAAGGGVQRAGEDCGVGMPAWRSMVVASLPEQRDGMGAAWLSRMATNMTLVVVTRAK
jgi:hypothetical protein